MAAGDVWGNAWGDAWGSSWGQAEIPSAVDDVTGNMVIGGFYVVPAVVGEVFVTPAVTYQKAEIEPAVTGKVYFGS